MHELVGREFGRSKVYVPSIDSFADGVLGKLGATIDSIGFCPSELCKTIDKIGPSGLRALSRN